MSLTAFYDLINDGSPVTRTLSATATLDFPSISAAGTEVLTVSCPGALVNDCVVIGLPATVNAGVVFDARVSSGGTITLRASNITAAPIDPASATYKFVVFQL